MKKEEAGCRYRRSEKAKDKEKGLRACQQKKRRGWKQKNRMMCCLKKVSQSNEEMEKRHIFSTETNNGRSISPGF